MAPIRTPETVADFPKKKPRLGFYVIWAIVLVEAAGWIAFILVKLHR